MIKKTITFKNMDGVEITEDWYFALDADDVAMLELSSHGQLSERLKSVGESLEEHEDDREGLARANGAQIMALFRELIMTSVGKRSEDGRRHIKNADLVDDFKQTGSLANFLIDLVNNPTEAAEFINGIMPSEALEKLKETGSVTDIPLPENTKPAWFTEGRVPSEAELKGVNDPALLQEAFRRKSAQPSQ